MSQSILPGWNPNAAPVPQGGFLGAFNQFMPGLNQGLSTIGQHKLKMQALEQERIVQNAKMAREGVNTLGEIMKLPKNMRKSMIKVAVEKMGVNPDIGGMMAAADDEQAEGLAKMLKESGEADPHATLAGLAHDPVQVMARVNANVKERKEKETRDAWAKIDKQYFGESGAPGLLGAAPEGPELLAGPEEEQIPAIAPTQLAGPPTPAAALPAGVQFAAATPGTAIDIAPPALGARPGATTALPGAAPGAPAGVLTRAPAAQGQETVLRGRLAEVENRIRAASEAVSRAAASGLPIDENRQRAIKIRMDALTGERDNIMAQIKELPKPADADKDTSEPGKLLATRDRIFAKAAREGRNLFKEEVATVSAIDRTIEQMGVVKEDKVATLVERVAKAEEAARANPNDPAVQSELRKATRAWELHLASQAKTVADPLDKIVPMEEARSRQLPGIMTYRQAMQYEKTVPITAATSTQKEAAEVSQKILGELTTLSKKLHTAKGWVSRLTSAPSAMARQLLQTDTDLVVYNAASDAVLANFARIFGERGTLTDQDIDRARALIPKMWPVPDTKDAAQRKFGLLDRLVKEVAKRPQGSAAQFGTPYNPTNSATGASSADLKKELRLDE